MNDYLRIKEARRLQAVIYAKDQEIARLRNALERDSRIAELEAQLKEARELLETAESKLRYGGAVPWMQRRDKWLEEVDDADSGF